METKKPESAEVIRLRDTRRKGFASPEIENLYRSHWKDLCHWLRRRYGAGPPEPEDVAQTAFMKMADVKDLASIENPRAYLFSIAANTALTGIKWLERTRRFIEGELAESGHSLEEISPERAYSSRERFGVVTDQLEGLPEKQREIVIRSRLGGQTYEQISAETGWSMADISRQLTAALTAMREALETYDGNETDTEAEDRWLSR